MNTKTGINSFENIGHILKGLGQMQGRLNSILHLLDYCANLLRGNTYVIFEDKKEIVAEH